MRQVPNYTIIGDGRVARHFAHYFSLLNLSYRQWSRSQDLALSDALHDCTHVLILISDAAIEPFITAHPELSDKCLIHFSGSLVTGLAYGIHPLMAFGPALYDLKDYQEIPFVLDQDAPDFFELFPALSNSHFRIPASSKRFYHAMCVMANNFTTILWNKFFSEMQDRFSISKQHLLPFLQRTMKNLSVEHQTALTGPLARGDQNTISSNLDALKGDPFELVYEAFSQVFERHREKEHGEAIQE